MGSTWYKTYRIGVLYIQGNHILLLWFWSTMKILGGIQNTTLSLFGKVESRLVGWYTVEQGWIYDVTARLSHIYNSPPTTLWCIFARVKGRNEQFCLVSSNSLKYAGNQWNHKINDSNMMKRMRIKHISTFIAIQITLCFFTTVIILH